MRILYPLVGLVHSAKPLNRADAVHQTRSTLFEYMSTDSFRGDGDLLFIYDARNSSALRHPQNLRDDVAVRASSPDSTPCGQLRHTYEVDKSTVLSAA
jgi:hypothetical protein